MPLKHKKRLALGALLLAGLYFLLNFFGGWGLMFDLAEPSGSASEPVQLYPIGRLVLPVPTALKYMGSSYKLDEVDVREHSWKSEDRAAEWRAAWQPVRDEGERKYLENKQYNRSRTGCFAEKNLSALFGYPAMFVCYPESATRNGLNTYVLLPDTFLSLLEERRYETGDECGDIDVSKTQLPLFKNYRYGKENPAPGSFFTAQGRIEGLKFKNERTSAYFKLQSDDGKNIDLGLRTYIPHNETDQTYESIKKIIPEAKMFGLDIEILRSRQRNFNGMEGFEEVFVTREKNKEGLLQTTLYAAWEIKGEPGNPEKPYINLEMSMNIYSEDGKETLRANPKLKEQTLRMWKTVTEQLTTAKEYYSR